MPAVSKSANGDGGKSSVASTAPDAGDRAGDRVDAGRRPAPKTDAKADTDAKTDTDAKADTTSARDSNPDVGAEADANTEASGPDASPDTKGLTTLPATVPKLKIGEAAPAPDSPGAAWFAVGTQGLVRLADGKFSAATSRKLGMVSDVAFTASGDLVVLASRGIFKVSKIRGSDKIGNYREPGVMSAVAVAPDGTVWTVGFKGVFTYDGRRWEGTDKKLLGPKVKLLQDVAVGADGEPWVLSSGGIHRRVDGVWKLALTTGNRLFFRNISRGKTLVFAHSKGLLRLVDGKVLPWQLPVLGRSSIGQMAALSDGGVAVRTYSGVTVVRGDGTTRRFSDKYDSFAGRKIETIATDASGRVWVSTDHGVAIIGDDNEVTVWAPGAIPLLTGEVRGIYVEAGGPALPKVGDVQRGDLKGVVSRGGEPVAGAPIEVCRRPDAMFGTTPCSAAPFKLRGTTGPKGGFSFSGVPVGAYRFAVNAGGTWKTTQIPCCQRMKAGEVFDVGTVELK